MKNVILYPLAAIVLCTGSAQPETLAVRGVLPWHNFLSGPTSWEEADYERYLDWMKKSGLNLLVLHCYTGGGQRSVTYVEPMIRIEYRNVVPEASFDTSLTARWGYRPLAVSEFAFGGGALFPKTGDAFGARPALLPRTREEHYRHAQALVRRVMEMAHARGIKIAMGFEFGIHPPEFASILPQTSMFNGTLLGDPTHPASIEILRATVDDILRAYPGIDWIWLWLQEHSFLMRKTGASAAFSKLLARDSALFGPKEETAFLGVWALAYIRAARDYVAQRAPSVRLAISGWGNSQQLAVILQGLDQALPRDLVFTCLNPAQGRKQHPDAFEEIAKRREVWAIPWLEGDAKLWHPQPRVGLMREHVQLAARHGLKGVVAIHWRTEDIRANMDAFARFAADPAGAPSVEEFYAGHCRSEYGPKAGSKIAPLLARMDREQWFEPLWTPEYYPYDPSWGRLKPDLRDRLLGAASEAESLRAGTSSQPHRDNLAWLAANFRFTLLLDEVSAAIEPAYVLKEKWLLQTIDAGALEHQARAARAALHSAPVERMFKTYAGRVRSRGELGVLSAINQKLWLQYLELERFLESILPEKAAKRAVR